MSKHVTQYPETINEDQWKRNISKEKGLFLQMKYKRGKKDISSSLYSTLPETLDILHAKKASKLQSEVKNLQHTHSPHTHTVHTVSFYSWIIVSAPVCVQLKYKQKGSSGLFHLLPETLETARAKEVSELLSEVTTERNEASSFLMRRRHSALLFFVPGEV